MRRVFTTAWAQGIGLALMLALPAARVGAQGTIVHVVPEQPIGYNPVINHTFDIDLNGDGIIDYSLLVRFGEADLQPHGNNSFIVVPELPPDLGSFVAALNQEDAINSNPSSLNPIFQWFDVNTDPIGYSLVAMEMDTGTLGYFFGGVHYVGLRFESGGANHFGWMAIDSLQFAAAGQVLDWAYEIRPDTPIFAGAVPEPSTFALLALSGVVVGFLRRKQARK